MARTYHKRKLGSEPHETLVIQLPVRTAIAIKQKAKAECSAWGAVASEVLCDFFDSDERVQLKRKEQALLNQIALQAGDGVEGPGDPIGQVNPWFISSLRACRRRIAELESDEA